MEEQELKMCMVEDDKIRNEVEHQIWVCGPEGCQSVKRADLRTP
jgi:hypothetical protein